MLAVAGGKGGCGKTTTTYGLAVALSRAGRTVRAVDADFDMPNLHVLAGVDGEPNVADLGDGEPVEAVVHSPPDRPGIEIVPAPRSARSGVRLSTALSRLDARAVDVLLDCPAGAGRTAATPLRLADRALLVTTLDPACLRDTAKTAAMARALDAEVVGAVVIRADGSPTSVERLLDCPVLASVPEADAPVEDVRVSAAHDRLASAILSKSL